MLYELTLNSCYHVWASWRNSRLITKFSYIFRSSRCLTFVLLSCTAPLSQGAPYKFWWWWWWWWNKAFCKLVSSPVDRYVASLWVKILIKVASWYEIHLHTQTTVTRVMVTDGRSLPSMSLKLRLGYRCHWKCLDGSDVLLNGTKYIYLSVVGVCCRCKKWSAVCWARAQEHRQWWVTASSTTTTKPMPRSVPCSHLSLKYLRVVETARNFGGRSTVY